MERNITTGIFKINAKKVLAILWMEYGTIWISIALCISLGLIILGCFYDYRFFFLVAVWIFLLIPLSAMFLYIYYGLMPLTVYNVVSHKVIIDRNRLCVIIEEDSYQNETQGFKFESQPTKFEKKISKKIIEIESYTISKLKTGPDYFVIFFKEPKEGFLFFPLSHTDIKDLKNISDFLLKPDIKN